MAEWDFSGYATKNDLKCSDGRVIKRDAFKHQDGITVPLVWRHLHDSIDNVLGHVLLENRSDGVYAYGKFNDSEAGKKAKLMVHNGDLKDLSIYANKLKQAGTDVIHGMIREVSLVLAGANPGATIDNLAIEHEDGSVFDIDTEAIFCPNYGITTDVNDDSLQHEESNRTVEDVYNSMTEEQKDLVVSMIGELLSGDGEMEQEEDEESNDGGGTLKHNVFENDDKKKEDVLQLSDDQVAVIFDDAKKMGSLRKSILAHADDYGITNIEMLFPEAHLDNPIPEFIKRDTDWVSGVLNETSKSPFAKIKSMQADITHDEARAKGYIKGNLKKDEYFSLISRETGPCTIYKRQKLDRDDIIDITSFAVVSWIKGEMRIMLNEEIARAILVGDGRAIDDPDKIKEDCIRPICSEEDLYATHYLLPDGVSGDEELEEIMKAMLDYKGSGSPKMYTTDKQLLKWKLIKDNNNRRIYSGESEIASLLGVSSFVKVPVMEGVKSKAKLESGTVEERELVGIIVNLRDYKVGTNKGGEISNFEDFDIDYNQYKYLMEGRMSGCLTKMKSAIIIERKVAAG